jgi:hypothetical protein
VRRSICIPERLTEEDSDDIVFVEKNVVLASRKRRQEKG